jgi:hypothetical protein
MLDKKMRDCIKIMRDLISDVQGAPYPGDDIKSELYSIWYEHAQRAAVECFEYLDANFPAEQKELDDSINKILK